MCCMWPDTIAYTYIFFSDTPCQKNETFKVLANNVLVPFQIVNGIIYPFLIGRKLKHFSSAT